MKAPSRFILAAGLVVASISGLIIWSLAGTTAYYKTPSELAAQSATSGERLRVAGKVVPDSIHRSGQTTGFAVTDGKAEVSVTTEDILPDTFGVGVDVVAEGAVTKPGLFTASSVLTKCPSKFKARLSA